MSRFLQVMTALIRINVESRESVSDILARYEKELKAPEGCIYALAHYKYARQNLPKEKLSHFQRLAYDSLRRAIIRNPHLHRLNDDYHALMGFLHGDVSSHHDFACAA